MADDTVSPQGQDDSTVMGNQPLEPVQQPPAEPDIAPSSGSVTPPPSFVSAPPPPPPNSQEVQQPGYDSVTPPPVFTQSSESTSTSGPMIAHLQTRRSPIGKVIGIGVLLVAILGIAAFLLLRGRTGIGPGGSETQEGGVIPKQQVNLTYWGLWEPSAVMSGIISEYQSQNPNVTITYVEQKKNDYRARLQTALSNGTGPDIFRFHNTWLPMLQKSMQPDSQKRVAMDDFLPKVKEDAVKGGETFGVPMGFDSLVLFYNAEKFQSAGLSQPPATWNDLITYADKLVVKDPRAGIQVGGVAMGTTNNVDHWSDIVGLLLMQNESDPAVEVPSEVLEFYTQFAGVKSVWDATLPNSTYAFATEKVAMMFAPSWRAHEIRAINPTLDFKTAPAPQLSGATPVAWASYWMEGVSRQSQNSDEAWKFLAFLTSSENLTKLYTTAAQSSPERKFGEPYPRLSLVSSLQADPVVGSVVTQGSYAKSWYLCSRTFDDGLNDGIIKYFEDAVNAMNKGSETQTVLSALQSGIQQKLSLFGLSTAPAQQVVSPAETPNALY